MPSWYSLIRAARYLGVPPWELMYRVETLGERYWVSWATAAAYAEKNAEWQNRRRAENAEKYRLQRMQGR